jgi:hypothetical protein
LKQRRRHYKSSLREMEKIASVARASGSQLTEAQVRKARIFFFFFFFLNSTMIVMMERFTLTSL